MCNHLGIAYYYYYIYVLLELTCCFETNPEKRRTFKEEKYKYIEIDQAEEGGYGPPKAKFMRLD